MNVRMQLKGPHYIVRAKGPKWVVVYNLMFTYFGMNPFYKSDILMLCTKHSDLTDSEARNAYHHMARNGHIERAPE